MSIVVLGSANLDLVYSVDRIPAPGETVLARGFASYPGGKGNNQAIAAARCGADTRFILALGTDAAAERLAAEARAAGIDLRERRVDAPTGTAVIYVDPAGENSIVVNSGANAALVDLTEPELAAIAEADLLVLQLETPLETVRAAVRAAKANDTVVILNAAPSGAVPDGLLREVDVLIVNEHEAADLVGEPDEPGELLLGLAARGCSSVITLGAGGAVVADTTGQGRVRLPAVEVEAVDTTGAGDTFVGAFAAALDHDRARAGELDVPALAAATAFANCAAALAVQREGAVPSIPFLAEVKRLHDRQGVWIEGV